MYIYIYICYMASSSQSAQAPVAKASATPASLREGVGVMIHGLVIKIHIPGELQPSIQLPMNL